MWSRPKIKTDVLMKYKEYAKEHGIKLWKVFDDAIKALEDKPHEK